MRNDISAIPYGFVDIEVSVSDSRICDIGALRHDGATFHQNSVSELRQFIEPLRYLCGHNIVHHDAKFLFGSEPPRISLVDTLHISPILFPSSPYHRLLKDDKILSEQANNPVCDCEKARDLLFDDLSAWESLPPEQRSIYVALLKGKAEFAVLLIDLLLAR